MLVFLVDKVNTHFFSRLVWEHLIQDVRVWVGKILEGILLRKKTFKFYINKKKYCLKKIQVWPIIDSIIAPLSKLQKVKCHGQTLIFLSWFRAHLCLFVFDPASPPPRQTSKERVTSNSQSTTPLVIIICQSTPEIISCTSTPRHQTWQLHLRMHYSCSRVAVSCSTIRYAKTVTFIPQQRFRNTHHLHRSVCPSHGPADTKSPLCDNHRAG